MSSELLTKVFSGHNIRFRSDGWMCATEAAGAFNYKLQNWIRIPETREIIVEIASDLSQSNSLKSNELEFEDALPRVVETSRGRYGGTWIHPKLVIYLAMTLNKRFAVWCIEQIELILTEQKSKVDWGAARFETKESNKARNATVQAVLTPQTADAYKEMSLEIWHAMTGHRYRRLVRDKMSSDELLILAEVERTQEELLRIRQDWTDSGSADANRLQILMNQVNRLRVAKGLLPIRHNVNFNEVALRNLTTLS